MTKLIIFLALIFSCVAFSAPPLSYYLAGTANPTVTPINAPQGSVYARVGPSGGKVYIKQDNGSSTNWLQPATPGGSTTQIQFNDSGNLNGNAALTFDKVTGRLFLNGATSGSIGVSAPSTVTSYNLVLPSAQGGASTLLQNDGAGNLSWTAPPVTGANTSLSNLTSTSINQNLLPNAGNVFNLGSHGFSWNQIWGGQIDGTVEVQAGDNTVEYASLAPGTTLPSGTSVGSSLTSKNGLSTTSLKLGLFTQNDSTANSTATGDLRIETGNKTAGTGNSGNIVSQTGTSSGGTRGQLQFKDGTEGQSGYSWTSTDANGSGKWAANSSVYPVSGNELQNSGWEYDTNHWTASGGTYTRTTTTANVGSGFGAASWAPSGSSQTFKSDLVTIPAGMYAHNGAFSCNIKGATSAHTLSVSDGTNTLSSVTIPALSTYTRTTGNFIFPSSGSLQIVVTSAAADSLDIDDCYLGSADQFNLTTVSQAQFLGSIKISGCSWATTTVSSTPGAFSATTGCTYTTTGILQSPGTEIPGFILPSVAPGTLRIVYTGSVGASSTTGNSVADFNFFDGSTNSETQFEGGTVGSSNFNTDTPVIEGRFTYTTPMSNVTYQIYGAVDAGVSANVTAGEIDVYYFPSSSQTAFNPATTAWHVNTLQNGFAAIAIPNGFGGGFTGDDDITSASIVTTLENGSISALVPCSGGFDSTGTSTCASGNPQIGTAFIPPTTGLVDVCAQWSLNTAITNANTFEPSFRIAQTSNTNGTVIVSTGDGSESFFLNGGDTASGQEVGSGMHLCTRFNLTSAGSKITFRLQASQDGNISPAAFSAPVTWRVTPVTQNVPMPVLVGSVTNPSSTGSEVVARVSFGGSGSITSPTNCTSDPCTIYSQSGSWVSAVNWSSTGSMVIHYSGFSSPPTCTISSTQATDTVCGFAGETSTTLTTDCFPSTTGTAANTSASVICMGPH